MHWKETDSLPPKGRARRERIHQGRRKGKRTAHFRRLVEDYRHSDMETAELIYDGDEYTPDFVLSNLNSAITYNEIDGVRIVRRGDRVFAQRKVKDAVSFTPDMVRDTLHTFVSSGARHSALETPDGWVIPDTVRLYHALHYHRTRLGYGWVRVSMTTEGITLTDTMQE